MITLVGMVNLYGGGAGSGCHGPNCGRPLTNKQLNNMVSTLRKQGLLRRRGITTGQVIKTYQAWENAKPERDRIKKEQQQAVQRARQKIAKQPKPNYQTLGNINVQPVSKGKVKIQMNVGNGTSLTILKPKGQYEKTNASWLKKESPYKNMFTRILAMDQYDDNKTKNSIWVYRDAKKGVALQVSRKLGEKAVLVKEIDTENFDDITRTREARFNNIGRASGFLNKRYGVTFKLGGPA